MDVFLSDGTKEAQDIEAARSLLQPAMQNGATLLEAVEIISGDNLSAIKRQLADIDKKREEMIQAQQQAEQQMQQLEAQLKGEELRITEEDSIRRAQTDLMVAQIRANAGMEDDGFVEETKLQLQKEKQDADAKLKEKQLQETARSNKKAEAQKQEEISIKRTQANKKPASTK